MSRILVVDDQEFPRQAVVDLIEHEFGVTAATAASAGEALAAMAEQAFDLVITDLKMDEMDGIQLLERVRSDHPGTEVIVVTGYGSIEDAVEAMRIGAVHGYRGLVRELIVRVKRDLDARQLPVIATGGHAKMIARGVIEITAVRPRLTLEGLRLASLDTT